MTDFKPNRQYLRITAVLELNATMYPPDDADCQSWLIEDILLGDVDRLRVVSSEIGDEVGVLHVEKVEEVGRG